MDGPRGYDATWNLTEKDKAHMILYVEPKKQTSKKTSKKASF